MTSNKQCQCIESYDKLAYYITLYFNVIIEATAFGTEARLQPKDIGVGRTLPADIYLRPVVESNYSLPIFWCNDAMGITENGTADRLPVLKPSNIVLNLYGLRNVSAHW